jgi:hypothetical protein
MSDINTSKGHKQALSNLTKDINRHETELVELRALQHKLIRIYERSKASELISHLHEKLVKYQSEEV